MIKPRSFSATPMGSVWGGCFLPTAEAVGYANPAAMRLRWCVPRCGVVYLCRYAVTIV
ncbi:MAG: hypothetical protein IAB88_02680 [Bacteroidetes bacterium]|uniref:Uncharacterized protein n=1 Tax=Candidatus Limisoma faecipullorum TaxID=2840854 RepID=A0A9D9NJ92_9BACT|nr:hypothetical protein [Candidatus Limisoma faecipullorum]